MQERKSDIITVKRGSSSGKQTPTQKKEEKPNVKLNLPRPRSEISTKDPFC